MTNGSICNSPKMYARVAGLLYLIVILLGFFAEGFVVNKLIVPNDSASSAKNILAAPELWNLGCIANLIVLLCAIPVLWIEYQLLKPVNKSVVVLAVMFNMVSFSMEAISKLFYCLVLPVLTSPDYLKFFEGSQLQVIANIALRSHDIAFYNLFVCGF